MDGNIGSMGGEAAFGMYLGLAWAVVEVAKRVASLTPGKADDEIVNSVERLLRKVIDFMAGQHTDRGDPGMIKPSKQEKDV